MKPHLSALLLALSGFAGVRAPAQTRPNVLVLFSDDQRTDTIHAWGNGYIETPNIDALVRRGFGFRRAYCMGSNHGAVCGPSRAMLLSGRSLFHVYDKILKYDILPQYLQQAGYETFATGKWHFGRPKTVRGFDRVRDLMFRGMSNHLQVPVRSLEADGSWTKVERKGFSSEVFANAAVDFLDHYASQDGARKPFFAWVAFSAPHDPRMPPGKYRTMYDPNEVPLPPDFMPVHPFHNGWMRGRDEQLAAWPRTPGVVRSQIAEYWGMISHLDTQIGRILDTLREHDLESNTIVVFASDHGLSVGSHGLLGKQNLYEHSMRTPLVVAGPGIPKGKESNAFVYLYDLFPTILGLAGAAAPAGIDGLDLAPIWRGEKDRVRDVMFTAYERNQRALFDGRYKLIQYPETWQIQLFDIENDPFEFVNLATGRHAAANRQRVAAMLARLATVQKAFDDPQPLKTDTRKVLVFDPTKVKRRPDRSQPKWIVEKYFGK